MFAATHLDSVANRKFLATLSASSSSVTWIADVTYVCSFVGPKKLKSKETSLQAHPGAAGVMPSAGLLDSPQPGSRQSQSPHVLRSYARIDVAGSS